MKLDTTFAFVLGVLRSMGHRIVPKGSSPEIYRRLVRSIYKRLVYDSRTQTVTVKKGLLAGSKKYGPFTEGDFEFAEGNYEAEVQDTVSKICRPGTTAFDLGANAGYFTLLFARLCGDSGHVHAFEPVPQNAQCLLETVRINELGNVTVHQVAISDKAGEAQMMYSGVFDGFATLTDGGHGYYRDQVADTVSVPTITLDQFCCDVGIPRVDVIKMDIEGAEMLALAGMSRILSTYRPVLIIEFWGTHNVIAGPRFLHSLGYETKVLTAWNGLVHRANVDIQTVLCTPIAPSRGSESTHITIDSTQLDSPLQN